LAKVLITVLGTGNRTDNRTYLPGKYSLQDSDKVYETSFIASALSNHLKVDKVFMIGTDKSMWEEVYRYFSDAESSLEKIGIWEKLSNKVGERGQPSTLIEEDLINVRSAIDTYLKKINPKATGGSICKLIKFGKNNQEIFENLSIIMDLQKEIQPGDEIYLDITHGFRSIPLFMYLMIDFIQTLRKEESIQLSGIFYGMFEAQDPETSIAPVVDLNPLFQITQWTKGIYEFTNYGNVDLMVKLLKDSKLKDTMKDISDLTSLIFIKNLRSQLDRLKELIDDEVPSPLFPYVKPKIQEFADFFKGVGSGAKFQFRLAEWYFQHGRYANGFICLAESIVTQIAYLYKKSGANIDYSKSIDRSIISNIIIKDRMKNSNDAEFLKASMLYEKIKKIRNNSAHAGFLESEDYKEIFKNTGNYLNNAQKLFFDNEKKLEDFLHHHPFEELKKNYRYY